MLPIDTPSTDGEDYHVNLMKEIHDHFSEAQMAYASTRTMAKLDLAFVAGEKTSNSNDPFDLQVNLLGPFLRQITAEARSANPAVRVVATSSDDVDIAEVRGGLIRAIEQESDSEAVYQTALWYAAACGEGYFLLDSHYVSDDSFDQNLLLRRVVNPETIFLDPTHQDPTGADANWGFIIKDISKGAYRRQFPDSELTKNLVAGGSFLLNMPGQWLTDSTVRVAQYWVRQYRMKKLWLIADPVTGEQTTVDKKPGPDVVLLRKDPREVQVCEIKGYTVNGHEILEKIDWPGSRLPIFKVTGDSFFVGGKLVQHGAVRHAIDPQRQYNYAVSRQTEMVDLAPKSPWVITTKQLGNNGDKWANANRISYGYLDYTNENGAQAPYKQAGINAGDFQAVLATRQQAYEDMKRVFGLNDASMGSVAGDMSGVAIGKQVEQGSRSTYQYFDNLLLAIKAVGRELNCLMPYFYDTDRIIRIVKPTNEDQVIAINSMSNKFRYDMTKGDFSVSVTTGPAYASKRQEAFNALQGIMGVLPEPLRASIADLVASQVDSPVAKLAAARFKAAIPQEILAATGEGNTDDLAPKEALLQAQSELAAAQTKIKTHDLEKKEMELRVQVAEDKTSLELTKLQVESDHNTKQQALDYELGLQDMQIKVEQLRLQEMKVQLARDQLQIQAGVAAHQMNNDMAIHDLDSVV